MPSDNVLTAMRQSNRRDIISRSAFKLASVLIGLTGGVLVSIAIAVNAKSFLTSALFVVITLLLLAAVGTIIVRNI